MIKLGVIGDPVSQSPSPQMCGAALKNLNRDGDYTAYHLKEDELEGFVERIRQDEIHGVNVTIPHKQKVLEFVDEQTEAVQKIGAANVLYCHEGRVIAANTDYIGFLKAFPSDFSLQEKTVIVLGAGGAARAILHALTSQNVEKLHVVNRNFSKAETLTESFPQITAWSWSLVTEDLWEKADLIVNTTSLGMKDKADWQDLRFLESLHSDCWIYDIVANPIETTLLKSAKEIGLNTISGFDMLLYQGEEALKLFLNQNPDVTVMREALAKALNGGAA